MSPPLAGPNAPAKGHKATTGPPIAPLPVVQGRGQQQTTPQMSIEKVSKMAGNTCDTCGSKEDITGVVSSGLGPISFCFCKTCLTKNAEPAFMFEFMYEEIGEDVADHVTHMSTFIDGKYLTWKEYVEIRKSCFQCSQGNTTQN
jgi:hypothetical protein